MSHFYCEVIPSWDYHMDGDNQVFNRPSGAAWAYTDDRPPPALALAKGSSDMEIDDCNTSASIVSWDSGKSRGHQGLVKKHILKIKGKGIQEQIKGSDDEDMVKENPNKFKGKGKGKAMRESVIEHDIGKGKGTRELNIDQTNGKGKTKKVANSDHCKGKGKAKKEPNLDQHRQGQGQEGAQH